MLEGHVGHSPCRVASRVAKPSELAAQTNFLLLKATPLRLTVVTWINTAHPKLHSGLCICKIHRQHEGCGFKARAIGTRAWADMGRGQGQRRGQGTVTKW